MLLQNPREFYREVYGQPFAVPAFNVCNLEMAKAVIEAAVVERAPVIVQTYPGDLAHAAFGNDVGPLPLLIRALAQEAPVPVIMHLDHGPGLEYNLRCLRAGYNSVMYDGHDLPLEAALAETAAIARAAHALHAAVEGELGTFGGSQGSHEYTNPDETPLMFEQGHVDMLAVSVGSEHGQSSRLNLDLLAAINDKVHAPLVLHGGSGIHEDDVRATVRLGVVKINIGAARRGRGVKDRVKGWRLARITTACSSAPCSASTRSPGASCNSWAPAAAPRWRFRGRAHGHW